jgi:hypothetical protein
MLVDILLGDTLILAALVRTLLRPVVVWRGRELRVGPGGKLHATLPD